MTTMRAVLTILLMAGLAACGGGGGEDQLTEGQRLFAGNCATCHGIDLRGTNQGPPLLHPFYEPGHHPDAAFVRAIDQGVEPHHWEFGPMPPIPGLSDEQADAIITYVRREQRRDGIE